MSSVHSEVVVEAPAARAFEVFTNKMGAWWPQSHHIGKVEFKNVVVDPQQHRWYELGVDGSECEWGRVLVWDPPRRLVLGWQLTVQWQYDPSFVTEVEVNFTPISDSRTRVALEHRNLEKFGEQEEQIKASVGSEGGWPLILNQFAELVGQPERTAV